MMPSGAPLPAFVKVYVTFMVLEASAVDVRVSLVVTWTNGSTMLLCESTSWTELAETFCDCPAVFEYSTEKVRVRFLCVRPLGWIGTSYVDEPPF